MVIDFLQDYIGWPVSDLVENAAHLGINVKIVKEWGPKGPRYKSVKRQTGDLLIEVDDGKVVWIEWHEK